MTLVYRAALIASQGLQMAPEAPDHGNLLHFPVQADGACSGPGQQLAGLVGAAPALTGQPMALIWRPGALMMVLGHVLGQECLIPLIIHSVTRASGRERLLGSQPYSYHRDMQMPYLCMIPT